MAIYQTKRIESAGSPRLDSRTFLSVNLQTGDAGFKYDPYNPIVPPPLSTDRLFVLPKTLTNRFLGQVATHPATFNRGVHFTIFENLYDKQNYPAGVITDTVALLVGVQQMSSTKAVVASVSVTTAQGVGLSGITAGDVFNAYEEKILAVTLDKEGAASISAEVAITFIGDPDTYYFTVVGFRFQLPFMLEANWKDGLTIKRSFMTDVFNSYGNGETRKILRNTPVRSMQADLVFLSDTAATQAWQVMRARAKGPNVVPFYPDAGGMTRSNDAYKLYCDTSYRRYSAGGIIMAIKYNQDGSVTHYDVLRILEVEADGVVTETEVVHDYTVNDTACPAMACYPSFGSDSQSNITRSRGYISIEAEEMYDSTAMALENTEYTPTVVDGLPIFDFRINEMDDMSMTTSFQGDIKSSGRGSTWHQQGGYTYSTQEIVCSAVSRAEYWELIGFFNYIRGRGRAFWIRNYSNIITPSSEGIGFLEVETLGAPDWDSLRNLWIEDASGISDVVAVTGVEDLVGGVRISYTGTAITPIRYYQAFKSRLDSDEIEEKWFTKALVEIRFTARELQGA